MPPGERVWGVTWGSNVRSQQVARELKFGCKKTLHAISRKKIHSKYQVRKAWPCVSAPGIMSTLLKKFGDLITYFQSRNSKAHLVGSGKEGVGYFVWTAQPAGWLSSVWWDRGGSFEGSQLLFGRSHDHVLLALDSWRMALKICHFQFVFVDEDCR